MKILLLSRYGQLGSSSRIRFYQYLPMLNPDEFTVTVAPFFKDAYLESFYSGHGKLLHHILDAYIRRITALTSIGKFDLIWVESEILPWMPAFVESALGLFTIPYVVEYDDAIFHRYDRHPNPIIRKIFGGKIDTVMRNARLVIAGSRYLAEKADQAKAKEVIYLPSSIDLQRYPASPASRKTDDFTIGWIGCPATEHYLQELREVFADLCRNFNIRVSLVGASSRLQLPVSSCDHRNWSEQTEVQDIEDFDVGIMPLPDNPWERGKCGYKLIQYMGCHKPVVASPVGANRTIVEHGVNGFLASTAEQWKLALFSLMQDPGLRARMGQAGRKKVESEFSVQANHSKLSAALRHASR